MSKIAVLDEQTIDKIAAGEVIERPASVVKELVENAIDAGANAVTVEIKEGGISFIRITDNGSGIESDEIPKAFLRHATSKIRSVEDLLEVASLGFRGEALSSICAVCQVELISKTPESLTGIRYVIEGSKEKEIEEIGAPTGTTFLVRNIFFNTPARKKFLKTAQTEAGYISDLMERMALSHPEVSFKFINNGQTRLHTSGNYNLKDIIYHIYGRDIAANILPIKAEHESGMKLEGFIGKPVISRGNRNYENYFINGRYVKSKIIAKAIEDAYASFMMKHQYPFTVLHFTIDGERLDVNVHPTKMELRFDNNEEMYRFVYDSIRNCLQYREMIPSVTVGKEEKKTETEKVPVRTSIPEPFEKKRIEGFVKVEAVKPPERTYFPEMEKPSEKPRSAEHVKQEKSSDPFSHLKELMAQRSEKAEIQQEKQKFPERVIPPLKTEEMPMEEIPEKKTQMPTVPVSNMEYQMEKLAHSTVKESDFFTEKLLDEKSVKNHRIIGQLFDTYWLIEFKNELYIIDQHAAHEKVLYERTMNSLKSREYTSQIISPPVILTLSLQEENLLKKHMKSFTDLGFEIESFGGKEFALRAVPDNLFRIAQQDLFIELLDSLDGQMDHLKAESIQERIASMSCKAAVKGNNRLSATEAHALIDELLTLENPYHCPHGRPTIISMSKTEIEKKFKRII